MKLEGRNVLVTGAARRVGAVIARQLAREGARVGIHYHTSSREADRLLAALRADGADVQLFRADLADTGQIDALFDALDAAFGGIDILVNNASFFTRTPLKTARLDDWNRILQVNLTAPFWCARHAARHMEARGGGVIIFIADLAGERGWPAHAAYSCTQAGLLALAQLLAVELAPAIRVNAVAPGTVLWHDDLDFQARARIQARIPLERIGTPEAVADAVRFLIEADFVTGEVIRVDGGRGVLP